MNINFYIPTKIIMTRDCVRKNADLFRDFGQTALLVTGFHSAKDNGSLEDVTNALTSQNISFFIYDKIMANPTVSCVYEGAAYAKKVGADFIIGIGGGSPMDAAKAIALLAVQEIPEEELFLSEFKEAALPVILLPTTAGSGSEVTANAILTSDKLQTKKSISSPILFPRLAMLDAKYMEPLPMLTTIHTALDALSHAVEGMLSVKSSELSNQFALESIKRITQVLPYLSPGYGQSISSIPMEVREELLYSSMLAGMVIAHTGTTAVHSMGYSLTYFKNIDHGRANALLLPSFLRFIAKQDVEIVNKIIQSMRLSTIDEFEALFLGLLGERESLTVKEIERFTEISSIAKSINNSKVVPTKEDIYNIYARSLQII